MTATKSKWERVRQMGRELVRWVVMFLIAEVIGLTFVGGIYALLWILFSAVGTPAPSEVATEATNQFFTELFSLFKTVSTGVLAGLIAGALLGRSQRQQREELIEILALIEKNTRRES